jgi:hypothetical protein
VFQIEPVTPDEIGERSKSKWETLFAHVEAAHARENGGVFVVGFEKRDAQNLAQSVRKITTERGMRLRWKQGERPSGPGMFLWLEPDTRPAKKPAVVDGGEIEA